MKRVSVREREISTSKKQYIGHVQRIGLCLDTMQFDHQQGNGFGFSTIKRPKPCSCLVVSLISKQMIPDEGVKASFRRGGNIALVFQFEPRGLIDRPAGALARTRPRQKTLPFYGNTAVNCYYFGHKSGISFFYLYIKHS